ncbi:hypothetical protein HN51_067659, partial [Arachis hypogaea]
DPSSPDPVHLCWQPHRSLLLSPKKVLAQQHFLAQNGYNSCWPKFALCQERSLE